MTFRTRRIEFLSGRFLFTRRLTLLLVIGFAMGFVVASRGGGAATPQAPSANSGADRGQVPTTDQVRSFCFSDAGRKSLAASGQSPRRGGTFVQSITAEYGTLNNVLRTTAAEELICRTYLFPPLLDIDADTLELVPLLATERPTMAADRRTYTWHLRPGVHWHRGGPDGPAEVTSRDVEFSWEMLRNPAVHAERARAALGAIESVKAVDRYTFTVITKAPYFRVELEFGYNFRLMPEHLAAHDADAFNRDPLMSAPVGYGPYRFTQWKRGEYLELAYNSDWFAADRLPYWFDQVRIRFVPDITQTPLLFERGELSLVPVNDVARYEEMKGDPRFAELATFHEYYLPQWTYIVWNHVHPAFADARVRRAMTMLYPRELVKEKVYLGHAAVISGPLAFATPEYDRTVAPLPFDPEAAKRLLDEAGWTDHDRDGIRDHDGTPLRFQLKHARSPVPAFATGNIWFQEQLAAVGVKVEMVGLEAKELYRQLAAHEFDAGQLSWFSDPRDDDLYDRCHSSAIDEGANYGGYRSEACDRLLEAYRSEFDRATRLDLAHQIHRQLAEDQPITPLYNPQSVVLVSTKLKDVKIHKLGARFFGWWSAP